MSYQRIWQIKKQEKGLCTLCGKRKIYKNKYCKIHYKNSLIYAKKYHEANKEKHLQQMAIWRKNNPDYQKKYYWKMKNKALQIK